MISFCLVLLVLDGIWSQENRKNCRDRNRLIENGNGDLYTLIDATLEEKFTLQCHYCDEKDDGRPKIWYKVSDISKQEPHELKLDMNNNNSLNRVHVDPEHTLTIHNFTQNDSGLYYCQYFEGEQEAKYNYLVDLVYKEENVTSVETGNLTAWRKYNEEYFAPINTLFVQSQGAEFRKVREEFMVEMEVRTEWGPWGICEVCGRPKNDGIKKKTGFCRIGLSQKSPKKSASGTFDEKFLKTSNIISCRSQILGRLLPGTSNLTRIIPNFVQIEPCKGTCNPDAEGVNKGWKTGKTAAFKYRKTFVLAQNSHLTLVCPESTLENKVVWKRNGKLLVAGESVVPPKPEDEPRILVDTFNTLYLVNVEESEEGNYTCQVDDIRMQQIVVFVISKSKLLTQAFVRHMMYLGLILSLTLPCYCAGIIIACSRKRYFKGYQQLKEEEAEKKKGRFLTGP